MVSRDTANHSGRCNIRGTSIASVQNTAEPPFFENRSSVLELHDMINGAPFLLRSLYFLTIIFFHEIFLLEIKLAIINRIFFHIYISIVKNLFYLIPHMIYSISLISYFDLRRSLIFEGHTLQDQIRSKRDLRMESEHQETYGLKPYKTNIYLSKYKMQYIII